ncbi:S-layer homology domain-containing protein [Thermicanus aegyptius]|uniref:S-layer homology domain-containing protein n=1 Tax=Thermicanus aegyptius TaxID=94009 RepID=UPI00041FC824|nr:S-layer homology domain-containing protein [Thermicanus aegyptius]
MKTKIVSSLLATMLVLSALLPANAFAESNIVNNGTINNNGIINTGTIVVQFVDVQVNNWAYEAISSMSRRNVVSGYEDGSFRPNNPISREEFAKMIAVTFSLDLSVTQDVYYSDVPPTRWSYPYILATKEYVTGYYPPKGQPFFDPTANATREDVATALVKIMGLSTEKYSSHFTDEDDISPKLRKYVNVAADHKLISGYPDGTFKPQNPITRAEIAVLLYRAIKGISDDGRADSPDHQSEPVGQSPDQTAESQNSSFKAPDLWADVVKDDSLPGEPITILIKGETTPRSTVTINGDNVMVDLDGSFSVNIPVTKDGTYNFEIKSSYKGLDTVINKSITITIDPPKLSLEEPDPKYVTYNTGYNIWFDWVDKYDSQPTLYVNGEKRTYLLGGGRGTNGYSGSFQVSLQNGENEFTIKLVNRYGKESNTVTKVVYHQPNNR